MKFKDVIETREEFRSIMKEPSELVTRKTLSIWTSTAVFSLVVLLS